MVRGSSIGIACALALLVAAPAASAKTETILGCGYESDFSSSQKPRSCFLAWPNLSNAEAAYPRNIKWKHWGHATATATARHRVKLYDPWTPITLKAFRRKPCGPGLFVYTRVQVKFPTTTHTWRTPTCADIHPDD